MFLANNWEDYELIDAGFGEKLERWGNVTVRRPEPQAVWPSNFAKKSSEWNDVDAIYHRSKTGGGHWEFQNNRAEKKVKIAYGDIKFYVELMSFKHTGVFPEQAINWEWMSDLIEKEDRKVKVLNLFAYTGGVSIACAKEGAEVCHVDASKGMIARAKENMNLSGLSDKPVRYIADDVMKFVQREMRRGNKYDAIVMDPPTYGRGPKGELWKIEDTLCELVETCTQILSDDPLFFLINSYTTGLTPVMLDNILNIYLARKIGGSVSAKEIGIPISSSNLILTCGASGRWEK